ncbi:hypothetical protein FP2506_17114 [Fulvimarina pelagi HTCC2506]|uniref:Uncharacterized protein n=1 Tax=Fulvimarina pelagi HTCC2506 TaxID=314231 RepID=Q0G2K7_9HYPH|nr:hypothetical protein FP2506_17114 [Fulvimarina pelagi HTCC2506]
MEHPFQPAAKPSSILLSDDRSATQNIQHLDNAFLIGAAIRLSRHRLSRCHARRMRKQLIRLAERGDATAPVVISWLDRRDPWIAKRGI